MEECAICLVNEINEVEKCRNDCGHTFCKSCIDTWFDRGNNNCPMCRQEINYFDHNNTHYRVIFKRPPTQRIIHPRTRVVTLSTATYRFIQYVGIGLLCIFLLQEYRLMQATERYDDLSDSYNKCLHNTSILEGYRHQSDYIDISHEEDVFIFDMELNKYIKCSIPYYYKDRCLS